MIAIIPARGGSKGLPGKNIKNLLGKPMIAYTIEAAKASKHITDIIISTDCEEIYRIAIEHGAMDTFLRPAELAKDEAQAIDNYIYTIDRLEKDFSMNIDSFTVLQPTSPLRTTEDIDKSIEMYKNSNARSVISYTEEHHPLTWHKYIKEDGSLENIFEDKLDNRQKFRVSYYPTGAVYVFNTQMIRSRNYFDGSTKAYIMPRERSVDIDTEEDFRYAEFLLERNRDD